MSTTIFLTIHDKLVDNNIVPNIGASSNQCLSPISGSLVSLILGPHVVLDYKILWNTMLYFNGWREHVLAKVDCHCKHNKILHLMPAPQKYVHNWQRRVVSNSANRYTGILKHIMISVYWDLFLCKIVTLNVSMGFNTVGLSPFMDCATRK